MIGVYEMYSGEENAEVGSILYSRIKLASTL